MALSSTYKSYLANPNGSFLAPNASLNYVTTTTSLTSSAVIQKHLKTQQQLVEKKDEKFLNVIENANSLCVETETTLHFITGGGAYLPGIDENFLADRSVTLPIVREEQHKAFLSSKLIFRDCQTHIVIFDSETKIQQIRISWDQGCLLKEVETIGARGRAWPIRGGKEQIKVISSSSDAAPSAAAAQSGERLGRRQSRGIDPHSTLNLFAPREPTVREDSPLKHVLPRESAKPAPRDMTDLFAAGSTDPGLTSPERSVSPSKRDRNNSNPLKSGAGKNHQPSRLFNHDQEQDPKNSNRESGIKTNASKYNHFDLGNGDDSRTAAKPLKANNKHLSQWDFQDFTTPEKPKAKNLAHHQPNYLMEEENMQKGADKLPQYRQYVPQARPSSNAQFDFQDNTPEADRKRPDTSSSSRSGLYQDHVIDNDVRSTTTTNTDQTSLEGSKMPLRNITNANTAQHNNNLSAHWGVNDAGSGGKGGASDVENTVMATDITEKAGAKSRAQNGMESSWSLYESSPVQKQGGIKIAGDGMGMRKRGGGNWWDFGDS